MDSGKVNACFIALIDAAIASLALKMPCFVLKMPYFTTISTEVDLSLRAFEFYCCKLIENYC